MLILASTSDIVRVVTAQAAQIEVHASYVDWNGSAVTPGRTNTPHITTATTTTVVAAPGASVQRNVKHLNITNDMLRRLALSLWSISTAPRQSS